MEENELFVLRERHIDRDGQERESVRHFQDSRGRMPLNEADTDARWRTKKRDERPKLNYQENVIVDRGGFIVFRKATHADKGDCTAVDAMLGQLPVSPETLTADTGYSDGRLRKQLEELGIKANIPIHPNHEKNMVTKGGFAYHGDRLICPEGKTLSRRAFLRRDRSYQYVALQKDCQRCPERNDCLPPGQKRRYVALCAYHSQYLRARERNRSKAYKQQITVRRTTAEGVFASLDRLGWERCKLRGLWKVECEGYVSPLAHNLSKAVRMIEGLGRPTSILTGERLLAATV